MNKETTTVNPGELKLLDWFAGCALIGLIANSESWEIDLPPQAAHDAFRIARLMLDARAKHIPQEEAGP